MRKGPCPICGGPDRTGYMCRPCERSYDRTAHRDGSIMEAMVWAAGRARRAERTRWARGARWMGKDVVKALMKDRS